MYAVWSCARPSSRAPRGHVEVLRREEIGGRKREPDFRGRLPLVVLGLLLRHLVKLRVLQIERDRPLVAVDEETTLLREGHPRRVGRREIREDDVLPVLGAGRRVHHQEHQVGEEPIVEDARPHLGSRLRRHHLEQELTHPLVRVGKNGDDEMRRREASPPAAVIRHGNQQAIETDAARAHRDDLAVGRQPAECDQHSQEKSHRDGEAQNAREEIEEDTRRLGSGGRLRHQALRQA